VPVLTAPLVMFAACEPMLPAKTRSARQIAETAAGAARRLWSV